MNPSTPTSTELQEKVLQLLNWSLEDYSSFMYETGLNYLKEYFGTDEEAIDLLSKRKEFWNWFKIQWSIRDKSFFEAFLLDECDMSFRLQLYNNLHNPEMLACEIYPSRQVLGNSFHIVKLQLS